MPVLPTALAFRASAMVIAGRFADASDLLAEAETLGVITGLAFQPAAGLSLAAHRGRELPALEVIDAAVRRARERDEGRLLGAAGYARAVLSNGLGRYPAAVVAARDGVEYGDLGIVDWTRSELVEAAARVGDWRTAAETRERLGARTAAAGTDWALGTQAVADALTGSPAQVEDRYREAVERLSATRLTVPLARARLLYGEWLRRDNRRSEARVELRAAHEAFAAMGADAFAERAGRELSATGETVRKRVPGAREQLTPQGSDRAAGCQRTDESRDRCRVVPEPTDGRVAPSQGLRQARDRVPAGAVRRAARSVRSPAELRADAQVPRSAQYDAPLA
jgi:hypothetical protein